MKKLHRRSSKVPKLILGFICICLKYSHTESYSQVLVNGNDDATDEGPKIFKALNMDLIYPRTFNSSENMFSTTRAPLITAAMTDPMLINIKQSQPEQQHALSSEQQLQPMTAQQSIIYVTPASDDSTLQLTTNNYESNIKAGPSHTPNTLTRTNNINPMLTVDNEQQASPQSEDVNKVPADTLSTLEEYASTGRAVDYNRPVYNFNQLITPLIKSPPPLVAPSSSSSSVRAHPLTVGTNPPQRTSNIGHIIYPQAYSQRRRPPPNRAEINKLNGKAKFSDRFTPGEAVASGQFTKHHQHEHKHVNSGGNIDNNKVAAASQIVQQTYKPSTDLYAFPPNINSQYASPYQDPKASLPSSNVNSYVAAPSGPIQLNSNYPLMAAASNNDPDYKYPGPTNPDAGDGDTKKPITTSSGDQNDAMNSAGDAADIDSGSDDTIGVLPASAMGDAEKDMSGKDNDVVDVNSGGGGGGDDGVMSDDHNHDHPPPVDDTEYPTPPPGWIEQHPEAAHDHHPHLHGDFHDLHNDHHFDFHHDLPTYPQYVHPYPEIIWNDHHNHNYPPLPPPTLPPATTEMPPPEPPPEPRVKKYSYFYIGRKLWYIPLYFTVWFSFYVLWLILKSIARHKVNLPNHYVNRRSLPDYASDTHANEYINELTVSVLGKIENFQQKYFS